MPRLKDTCLLYILPFHFFVCISWWGENDHWWGRWRKRLIISSSSYFFLSLSCFWFSSTDYQEWNDGEDGGLSFSHASHFIIISFVSFLDVLDVILLYFSLWLLPWMTWKRVTPEFRLILVPSLDLVPLLVLLWNPLLHACCFSFLKISQSLELFSSFMLECDSDVMKPWN